MSAGSDGLNSNSPRRCRGDLVAMISHGATPSRPSAVISAGYPARLTTSSPVPEAELQPMRRRACRVQNIASRRELARCRLARRVF